MLIAGLRRRIGSWWIEWAAPWFLLALTGGGFHQHPGHVYGLPVHHTELVEVSVGGPRGTVHDGTYTRGAEGNQNAHYCPACLWQLTAFSLAASGMPTLHASAPSRVASCFHPDPEFFSVPSHGARAPPSA